MSLHLSYRPDELDEFLGSETTIKALESKLNSEDRPHSYLITGPSGCGKTTLGRIIARKVGALLEDEDPLNSRNYKEMDSADFRGIDTIRNIRQQIRMSPIGGAQSRAWLLDECHQLTKDAQEALLKALEDTPKHVYFILATTDPDKLKDTLKRRCQHFQVSPFSEDLMEEFLKDIVEAEEKKVPDSIIEQIADNSAGSPGKALVILDKIIDLPSKDMEKEIESVSRQLNQAIDLCRAIIKKEKWTKITKILKDLQKDDAESIRRMVLKYCASILLKKEDSGAYLIMDAFRNPFYDCPFEKLILACYESRYAE